MIEYILDINKMQGNVTLLLFTSLLLTHDGTIVITSSVSQNQEVKEQSVFCVFEFHLVWGAKICHMLIHRGLHLIPKTGITGLFFVS